MDKGATACKGPPQRIRTGGTVAAMGADGVDGFVGVVGDLDLHDEVVVKLDNI